MKYASLITGLCLLLIFNSASAEKTTIRLGVQASGTVDWELSVINDASQGNAPDFKLDIHRLANSEAGKIALRSGSVDMIVSDWIWVSELRSKGADLTFYPYSTTSGALIVPEQSPIHSIKDLIGKRLGIAGGALDKNWLLLQALAEQDGIDLNASVEKVFGAPPLINEQLKQQRIDAALNYWHLAARLEAHGFRQLIDGKGLLKGLGIDDNVPTLGYVFNRAWALDHRQAVNDFLKAGVDAKNRICTDDGTWQTIVPMTKTDDVSTQNKLRERYCKGRIRQWGKREQKAAGRIYKILRGVSHTELTGQSEHLQPDTFWSKD